MAVTLKVLSTAVREHFAQQVEKGGICALCDHESNDENDIALRAIVVAALRAPVSETSTSDEPSELEVQAGAVILATTPMIESPKFYGHLAWMGLSREVLKAARDATNAAPQDATGTQARPESNVPAVAAPDITVDGDYTGTRRNT